MPKVLEREWMKTKTTEEMRSEINFRKVGVKIQDHEVRKGAFLKNDFVLFQILSEMDDRFLARTHRTDEDFYDLRKLLLMAVPYLMVPPLPTKNINTAPKKIAKR